ncbi:MAG: hypothetical protein JSV63_00960 [Candidatus Aenigmatarchaeota archaeon]|nr:MAG: hypothetical protein JSV63_00960 [Candidatus Aenigmarchaeota archaeon]
MGKDSGEGHRESKLESVRKGLEIDIAEREREAKERLDEILSEKRMEFCSRCGKKIGSRTDWAGKCLWEDCEELVCRGCWDVNKYKFCRKHSREVVEEGDEDPKKKLVFREEEPEIKADLSEVLDEHEESRKSKLQYYASEYSIWLQKRMGHAGPLDWTPTKYVQKARFRSEKKEGDYITEVYTKRWFWKSTKLTVIITPYDSKGEFDENSLNAYLHKTARRFKGYRLFVLVTDGAGIGLTHFVNRFHDNAFSLFLAEPKKGHLNFNIKEPLTTSYSEWFSKNKEPLNFMGRLKKIGDTVSGRTVVSEKAVAKEFGFDEREVGDILKSCKFLDPVKGTDTYLLKKG